MWKSKLIGPVGFIDSLRDNQPVKKQPYSLCSYLPNIGKILHRLHPVLKSSRPCQSAIEKVPMMAFRRPKSLKDILVHSEMIRAVTCAGTVDAGLVIFWLNVKILGV